MCHCLSYYYYFILKWTFIYKGSSSVAFTFCCGIENMSIDWHSFSLLVISLSLSLSLRHCMCLCVCVCICVERAYVWRGSHVLSSLWQGYEMSVQGCWRYLPHSHNTHKYTLTQLSSPVVHTHTVAYRSEHVKQPFTSQWSSRKHILMQCSYTLMC